MVLSDFLKTEGDKVYTSCESKVMATVTEMELKLAAAIESAKSRLSGQVHGYQESEQYSADSVQKLCEFLDEKIKISLEQVTTTSLWEFHSRAKSDILSEYNCRYSTETCEIHILGVI